MILSFQLNHSILSGHLARHSVLDLRHLPRMEGELLIG